MAGWLQSLDLQSLSFFLFNAAFTAFNARIAFMNWKREERKNNPAIDASIQYLGGELVGVELVYRTSGTVSWVPITAKLVKPKRGKIANPLEHPRVNAFNEPWQPNPIEVDWGACGHEAPLLVSSSPGREVIWIKTLERDWPREVIVDLIFDSKEPQPRRYRTRVSRVMPMFTAVIKS